MPTKYYMAFPSSKELEGAAVELLKRHETGSEESYVPLMIDTMEYFIPELLQSFLVGTVDAIGLSNMATKVVHSTSDLISKTGRMLVPQLLKKRSNEELTPLIGFVEDISLWSNQTENGKTCCGCELEKDVYTRMKNVVVRVHDGEVEESREEIMELMVIAVDTMLDGLMKRPIDMLDLGFVTRKVANGAMSTCHAAGHGVIHKVFKKLDDQQMTHLVDYFDSLVIYAER